METRLGALLDAVLIGLIPFLTRTQAFGGGISPYKAKFRLVRIAKNIDVRDDSKRHNEPVFALQMHTLLLAQGCPQVKVLAHDRSWVDYADAFSISRQYRRHLPVRELARCPYGHQQTNLRRQCRRAPTILKENFRSWDIIRDEGTNNRSVLNRHPCTLSSLMRTSQHIQNNGSHYQNDRKERYGTTYNIPGVFQDPFPVWPIGLFLLLVGGEVWLTRFGHFMLGRFAIRLSMIAGGFIHFALSLTAYGNLMYASRLLFE